MTKPKRYTKGMEDIERTFDILKDQEKKDRFKEWLKKRQEKKKPKMKGKEVIQ